MNLSYTCYEGTLCLESLFVCLFVLGRFVGNFVVDSKVESNFGDFGVR